MTLRIERAIDTLLEALKNRTLAKGSCIACAVGNLVAKGLGGTIYKNGDLFDCDKSNGSWRFYAVAEEMTNEPLLREVFMCMGIENIRATEFTESEFMAIEREFEKNTKIHYKKYWKHTDREILEDQIRGLDAVIKVMLEFDDCKETVREVFTDEAEKVLVAC